MPADRFARQRRLHEVGEQGQARLAALRLVLPASDTAALEQEYLLRAGVGHVSIAAGEAAEFPHAAHFHAPGPRRIATAAWRALVRLRAGLGIDDP
jgi:molybdopterin/thiamine biosynthesis adenylyltransferase